MIAMTHVARRVAAALAVTGLAACSSAGSLGNVLGSVLGGQGQGQSQGRATQVSGIIQGLDTRNQQIGIQTSNGQTVGILFDNQTRVVYQNQNYPVTSLERGDRVTMRLQSINNGYYTDLVQVDQSVSSSSSAGNTSSGGVQNMQGTVRQVDRTNGLFALDLGNGTQLIVSMPYAASQADVRRFQNLRAGDTVRLAGVFVNNTRVELRQFY
jgi:hypothetical protein